MKSLLLFSLTAVMLSVSGCRVNIGDGIGEVVEPSENIVKAKYPQEAFDMKVPLVADSGFGKNWLEAH